MTGGGGGGDVVPVSPRAEQQPAAKKKRRAAGRRRHHAQAATAAWLPLDIVVEIAARSDAATLVRCAATCRDARRRIDEDPNLRGRLRLRDTGRFLLPLLRGHLVGIKTETYHGDVLYEKTDVYLVDTTAAAADATGHLVKPTLVLESQTLMDAVPMDSRGGLVLARAISTADPWLWEDQLVVCDPATRRHVALPPFPSFPWHLGRGMDVHFVLLVGDGGEGSAGAVGLGRPFRVLLAKPVLSKHHRSERRLLLHTFSSEDGAWSRLTEIPTPNLHGIAKWPSRLCPRPLVVGDVVHWLCLTDGGSYLLVLHARAARVDVTAVPASFPRDGKNNHPYDERHQYLMATASAGGNPVVLVADKDKISAWEWQQSKHTRMWRPQVVMQNQEIPLAVANRVPELVCFAERSGVVLLGIHGCRLLWLDLHSKKIVRSLEFTSYSYPGVYCPYEMDSSSWVPTFSRAGTF